MRNYGFEGSYSSVRRFLRKLGKEHTHATCILDFEPGEATQVDFGTGPVVTGVYTGEVFKAWIFVMTLCFSRHQYTEIVLNKKTETWLGLHRRAFEFLNGVPAKVIVDNPKYPIVRACYHDPEVQRSYAEVAEGYGFPLSLYPSRDPQKKGRVESGVKYVRNSFLPLREFRSLVTISDKCPQNSEIKCPPTRAIWHTFRRTPIRLEVPYAREGGLDDYQNTG